MINKSKKMIAFIDFEMNTNGDMSKRDLEIIEYGLVISDGTSYKKYRGFVKPITTDHIFDYTTFVTGINNNALEHALTLNEMISKIGYLTKDCEIIYFWGDVDKSCLENSVEKLDRFNKFHLNSILRRMKNYQSEELEAKYRKISLVDYAKKIEVIDLSYEQAHRALPDALLLYKIYYKTAK